MKPDKFCMETDACLFLHFDFQNKTIIAATKHLNIGNVCKENKKIWDYL